MTAVARTAVLLRFDPILLERVDEARGVMKRTPFLVELIEEALAELERAKRPLPATHMQAGAEVVPRSGLFAKTEISHATNAIRESGPAGEPSGDTADPGESEGPDIDSPTHLEDSGPEQGTEVPWAGADGIEGSGGLGPDLSDFSFEDEAL